ncbi:MAG: zinc ribbon domain-containing protein [Lachnospiraceae bacterium]|nr:zinc ribbon domain-containing protein [Lachnospiraceae bacterium]
MFCNNCGNQIDDDSAVCSFCGATISKVDDRKKRNLLLPILGIVAGILFLLAAFFVGRRFLGILINGSATPQYKGIYYIKDGELWYSKFSGKKPVRMDRDVMSEGEGDDLYPPQLTLSESGKYIYYSTEAENGVYTLCRANATGGDDPVTVARDANSYTLISDTQVLYRDDEYNLYLSDGEDRERVARDVSMYQVDADKKHVVWIDEDGNLYYRPLDLKEDKEKLAGEGANLISVNDDSSVILYSTHEDGLYDVYEIRNFDEKEKIVKDALNYYGSVVNGKVIFYYINSDGDEETWMDIVIEDDCTDDAFITEPNIADYTTYQNVDSFWGPTTREIVDDSYYDELDKYRAKQTRDSIREYYRTMNAAVKAYALHCYVDGEDSKLDEGVLSLEHYAYMEDTLVVSYQYLGLDDIPKLKISELYEAEISGSEDVYTRWDGSVEDATKVKIANGSNTSDMKLSDRDSKDSIYLYSSDDDLYMLAQNASNTFYTDKALYKVGFTGEDLGSLDLIADEVSFILDIRDGHVYYFKDVDEKCNEGTLCCDEKRIDSDVESTIWTQNSEVNDGVFYYKNFDDDTHSGDLYVYKDNSTEKIARDVYSYYPYTDKYTALLRDYSLDDREGDLEIYDGKKCVKVAKDVYCLVY